MEARLQHDKTARVAGKNCTVGIRSAISRTEIVRLLRYEKMGGVIINTPAVCSVSKAAVAGRTEYLSTYWAQNKVRVDTITPCGVSSGQNGLFQDLYANRRPLGRMAEAHEMLGALSFLAGDAAIYITGQNLVIDGGLSVW
jgi:NAD(P)-dependent dehydrogenase (short-subunit alcohol dehydrogenase family)